MMTKSKVAICPYCGEAQHAAERCRVCNGFFEPLSRQATHNAMGPWFIRDSRLPFQPGCSYETLITLIERKVVDRTSIVRGPTTKQFWTVARRVPGISHLLGYCHHCDASVDPGDHGCHACGVSFGAYLDRNYLGLPEIRPLPWEADIDHDDRHMSDRQMASEWRAEESVETVVVGSLRREQVIAETGAPLSEAIGVATQTLPSPASAMPDMRAPLLPTPALPQQRTMSQTSVANESVLVRSLQRQLARQQRNTRNLMIVLIASLILFSVISIALMTNLRADQPPAAAQPPEQTAPAPQITPTMDEAMTDPVSAVVDEPAVVALNEESMALLRAKMESAAAAELELQARIDLYEQAKMTIDEMLAVPRSEVDNQELIELRSEVDRELQRLKMQQFFP